MRDPQPLLCVQLKEQASDSIMVLEGLLAMKKDFYVHTLRTLDLLAADPSTANGETESSTAGLRISDDELHCQVRRLPGGTCHPGLGQMHRDLVKRKSCMPVTEP